MRKVFGVYENADCVALFESRQEAERYYISISGNHIEESMAEYGDDKVSWDSTEFDSLTVVNPKEQITFYLAELDLFETAEEAAI